MILMHKNIPVAKISNTYTWVPERIYSTEHMPLGTKSFLNNPELTGKNLEIWNKTRSIPLERQNFSKIIEKLGCSIEQAKEKAKYVSLTDCYWLKEENASITWEDVNFYDNGFSDNVLKSTFFDILFSSNFNSPDFTTDGVLSKGWLNVCGKPTLIKTGILGENCNKKHLLCANEIVVSKIGKEMGLDIAEYKPIFVNNNLLCQCDCFVHDNNTEIISLLQIEKEYEIFDKRNILKFIDKNNCRESFDSLMTLNALVNNVDCHEKNISFFRNPNTLHILGMTPIYDMGSSLGFNNAKAEESNNIIKPFRTTRKETLSLVQTFPEILDKNDLKNILQEVYEQFAIEEQVFNIANTELQGGLEFIREEIKNRKTKISMQCITMEEKQEESEDDIEI